MLALIQDSRIQSGTQLLERKQKSLWKTSVLSNSQSIQRGTLTEWTGPNGAGKTTRLLQFFREQLTMSEIAAASPARPIVWIGERLELFPSSLGQFRLSPHQILFIEARTPENARWVTHQCLRSHLFDFIVLECSFSPRLQERQIELRRLQVDAERSQASVILLHEGSINSGGWAIRNHIKIS